MDIFGVITKFYRVSFDVKNNVVQLDGEEYDAKKDEITKRLGNGERLFVISVYQTIGAGQNLQYPIPKARKGELIAVNNHPGKDKKDFDAIYLDRPTNLLTQLSANLAEDAFVRYLFDVEMLQENAEISVKLATAHIKRAFRCFSTQNISNEYADSLYNCRSVILLATRVIIQAVGRMCRTNMKPKDIFVFADSKLAERMDFSICDWRMFNREFVELMNALNTASCGRSDVQTANSRMRRSLNPFVQISISTVCCVKPGQRIGLPAGNSFVKWCWLIRHYLMINSIIRVLPITFMWKCRKWAAGFITLRKKILIMFR